MTQVVTHFPDIMSHNPFGFHREVTSGQMYQYQVQAEAGGELGEASPPLSHIHGGPYCGDGKVAG
jgi:hypothetical protein